MNMIKTIIAISKEIRYHNNRKMQGKEEKTAAFGVKIITVI